MKKLIAILAVTVFFAGVSFGQDAKPAAKTDKKAKTTKTKTTKTDKKSTKATK